MWTTVLFKLAEPMRRAGEGERRREKKQDTDFTSEDSDEVHTGKNLENINIPNKNDKTVTQVFSPTTLVG